MPGEVEEEEVVGGGEGGTLVHGSLVLNTKDRAMLFSPDMDSKAGQPGNYVLSELSFMYINCYISRRICSFLLMVSVCTNTDIQLIIFIFKLFRLYVMITLIQYPMNYTYVICYNVNHKCIN